MGSHAADRRHAAGAGTTSRAYGAAGRQLEDLGHRLGTRVSRIAVAEHLKNGMSWLIAARNLSLMHIAVYDAMVAAWDSKYAYKRLHPSAVRVGLTSAVADPASPSYPSEHAVAAGAASGVLAYVFPDRAAFFREKAEEAARSRIWCFVFLQFPIPSGAFMNPNGLRQLLLGQSRKNARRAQLPSANDIRHEQFPSFICRSGANCLPPSPMCRPATRRGRATTAASCYMVPLSDF
jgi:hypothetical protein